MKKKSKRAIMIISLTLALVATGLSASYAWLVSNGGSASVSGEMGTVAVGISDKTAVGTDDTLAFTITNGSNIDTYMRLGWTPIYRDENGKDLTKDTQSVKVSVSFDSTLSGNPIPTAEFPNSPNYLSIRSLNQYEKNTVPLLYKDKDQGSDKYSYFLVHGEGTCEEIEGTITVTGIDPNAASNGETLHIILVPEAIQATKAAVTAASAYGWDEDLVVKQACTIVGGGE